MTKPGGDGNSGCLRLIGAGRYRGHRRPADATAQAPAVAPPFEVGVFDVGGRPALLRDPRARSPGPRVHARDPDGLQHEPTAGHRPGRRRPPGHPARPARATACRTSPSGPRSTGWTPTPTTWWRCSTTSGSNRAVVGGVSLGANVSLLVAAQAPERVQGMVLEMPVLEWAVPGRRHHLRAHAARRPLRPPAGQADRLALPAPAPHRHRCRSTAP